MRPRQSNAPISRRSRQAVISTTMSVLDSDGNSFSVSKTILDSDGNPFVVSKAVLDSDGNSFMVL